MQRANEQRRCHVSLSLSLEPSSLSISDDIREGQDSVYLRVLELKTGDVSQRDCTKAYKRLAMKYHPYKSTSASAGDKFKEVSRAYRKLCYQEDTSLETEDLFYSMFDAVFGANPTFHTKFCEGRGCPICHGDHHQRGIRKVNRSTNKKKSPGRKTVENKRKDDKAVERTEELKPMKAIIPEVEDIDENSVSLRWSKPLGLKVEIYTLEVAYGNTSVNSKNYHVVYQGKQTSYQVPNLKAGTQYCFRLKFSHFMLGESPWGPVFVKTQGKADDSAHPEILSNIKLANLRKREKKRLKRARQKARKKEKESHNISKKTQTGTQKQQKQPEPESEQIKKTAEISPKATEEDKPSTVEAASADITFEKNPGQPPSEVSFTTPAQSVISSPTPSGPALMETPTPENLDDDSSFSTAKKRKKKKKKIDQKKKKKQLDENLRLYVQQAGIAVEQYIELENQIILWRKTRNSQLLHNQEQQFEKVMTSKLRAMKLPRELLSTLFGDSKRRLIRDGPREALIFQNKRSTEEWKKSKEANLGATKSVKCESGIEPTKQLKDDGVGLQKAPLAKVWTLSERKVLPQPSSKTTMRSSLDARRSASLISSPIRQPPSPLYRNTEFPFVETPPRHTMARGGHHPSFAVPNNATTHNVPQHSSHNFHYPQAYNKPRATGYDNPFYEGFGISRGASAQPARRGGGESKHNSNNSFDLSGVLSPLGIDMSDFDLEQLGYLYGDADNR